MKRNCFQLQNRKSVNFMSEEQQGTYDFKRLWLEHSDDENTDYPCMMISAKSFSEPCIVHVLVETTKLNMEIDYGAAVSVIGRRTYRKYFEHIKVTHCNSRLVVVNGQHFNIFGQILVKVSFNKMQHQVSLIILDGTRSFVPLFGRNWLDIFYPYWRNNFGNAMNVNVVKNEGHQAVYVGNMRLQFPKICDRDFSNPIAGFEADLVLKADRPVFRKAYEVPSI